MALQKKSQHTAYEQERKYAMKKLKQMSGPYSIGFELDKDEMLFKLVSWSTLILWYYVHALWKDKIDWLHAH